MHYLRRRTFPKKEQMAQEQTLAPSSSLYFKLKNIKFKGKIVPIILQSVSGPCPLLAVANILTMRGYNLSHVNKAFISSEELSAHVSRYIVGQPNTESTEELSKNFEVSKRDALELLPKTFAGLDVNIKFRSITSCEFTKEMSLFDFCKIRLVHGWLPDPQDDEMFNFLQNMSYDQLIDKQIMLEDMRFSNEESTVMKTHRPQSMSPNSFMKWQGEQDKLNTLTHEVLLAERFLNETRAQITHYGLTSLHEGLYDEELCILFRNNHFSVLYKHEGELFDLVTDAGFGTEAAVWEKLSQIDGNTTFLKSDFTVYKPSRPVARAYTVINPNVDPIFSMPYEFSIQPNSDLGMAMRMQAEETNGNNIGRPRSSTYPTIIPNSVPNSVVYQNSVPNVMNYLVPQNAVPAEKKHFIRRYKNKAAA